MRTYRDRALVIRQYELGEADRIVVLLTREHGLVRAVAKGVRRMRSRFAGRIGLFTELDVLLVPGRSLDVVSEAESLGAWADGITGVYERFRAAGAVLEVAERLAGEERRPVPELFDLTVGVIAAIGLGARDPGQLLDAYLLRAMGAAGWQPALDRCAHCGAVGPHQAFHVAAGGAVCVRCRPAGAQTPGPDVLDYLLALRDADWVRVDAIAAGPRGPAVARGADGLVTAHLQWHLERRLRSLA